MRKDIKSGIYCIENIVNHKKYIGQSINIYDRWSKHRSELNKNIHDNDYLQKSWNKYGEVCFKFYIIEECEKNQLDEREIYYIDLYNTMAREYGYNLKTGGQEGSSLSDECRKKLSNSIKESYINSNLKDKRREDALKQWSDPNIKAKISGRNNGMYGKTHTEETRKKMSESAKGRISSQRNNTPVLCIELNKIFECASIAQKELSITTTILEVCYGHRKTAGGYHWKFVENNI